MARSRVAAVGAGGAEHPIVAVLQPNPMLGFLMQAAALTAFLGTLVGYWRRRTNEQFDAFPIVTRWTVVCFLVAAGYAVWKAIP
jgi:hypothetical protein